MKVAQSWPALCEPMDNAVHGILQARILEWVAVPFFKGSSQPRDQPRSPTLSRVSAVGNAEAGLQLEGQVLEPSAWGWIPALVAQR